MTVLGDEVPPLAVHDAAILIADDNEQVSRLLERILTRAGHRNVMRTSDPRRVVTLCAELDVDLLLLDLVMPQVDGFQILTELHPSIGSGLGPSVLVLTGETDRESRYQALELGARDFITKPFDAREVLLRVHNLLTTRLLQRRLRLENRQLDAEAASKTRELAQTRLDAVRHLALAAECHDDDTHAHTERVGRCAAQLAARLGCNQEFVANIRIAAPLHDVGKIGLPDRIFRKAGPLTEHEFMVIKTHTTIGASILGNSEIPELQLAQGIALTHHERWNGSGYPDGLAGTEIGIAGRIVAVADVFDALVHERPYKPAWSVERAVAEITAQRGLQFDAEVVDAFLLLEHGPLLAAPHVDPAPNRTPDANGARRQRITSPS